MCLQTKLQSITRWRLRSIHIAKKEQREKIQEGTNPHRTVDKYGS